MTRVLQKRGGVVSARRQAGFNLIEMLVAIGLSLVLASSVAYIVLRKMDEGRVDIAQKFFASDAPGSITSYVKRRGSISGLDKNTLTNTYGLTPNSAWPGRSWTVSTSGDNVVFVYDVGGIDPDRNGNELVTSLTNGSLPHIRSATYNAAQDRLTVTIGIQ